MASSENLLPPWLRPDFFPEKPDDAPYGYVQRGKLIGCSQETLIFRCRGSDLPFITEAWAPEVDRIVPVVELPFLLDAIRERTRKAIRTNLCIAIFPLVLYGLPLVVMGTGDGRQFEYRLLLLLSFAVLPLVQGLWQLRELRNDTPERIAAEIPSARYGAWVQSQPRPIAWVLLSVISVVFVVQLCGGLRHSVEIAGLTKTSFSFGGLYRFLTATLMHGGVPHILMNAGALFILGLLVEALLGSAGLALVFTISALGGSILSFACSSQTTVGASGGIMGLIGCLAVIGFHFRTILPPKFGRQMINCILLTAFTGYVAREVIDNAAHAGGLITGAALSWVLVRTRTTLPLSLPPVARWAGWVSLGLVVCSVLLIAVLVYRQ